MCRGELSRIGTFERLIEKSGDPADWKLGNREGWALFPAYSQSSEECEAESFCHP
jgi:hypothetical protein